VYASVATPSQQRGAFRRAYCLDGIPRSRRTEACLSARRTRTAIGRGTGAGLPSRWPASQPKAQAMRAAARGERRELGRKLY
jgi:hypothetical protein